MTAVRTEIPTIANRRLRIFASRLASRRKYACRARKGPSGWLRQRCVDLTGQRGHLLGELLVLSRQIRIGCEQLLELVRLGLQRRDPCGGVALHVIVPLLGRHRGDFVPLGLPSLREEDQRRRVGGLRGEGEIQQDEWIRIPVGADRDGVERDPDDHDDRLPDDVLRRAEEASRLLSRTAKRILTEGAVLLLGHASESTASDGQRRQLLVALV